MPRKDPNEQPAAPQRIIRKRLNEFESLPHDWIWQNYFVVGGVNCLEGDPGVGKSLFLCDLIARVTSGNSMPDGSDGPGKPLRVAYFSPEDDPGRTIKPRVEEAGGNTELVDIQRDFVEYEDGELKYLEFPANENVLCQFIEDGMKEEIPLGLIIFDPLDSYYESNNQADKGFKLKKVFSMLSRIASEYGICIIVLRHLTKDQHEGNAMYRGSGSIAIVASCRMVFTLAIPQDYVEEDKNQRPRVLAPVKCNITAEPPALEFKIGTVASRSIEDMAVPIVKWNPNPANYTVEKLYAKVNDNTVEHHDGVRIYRELMKDRPFCLSADVEGMAISKGVSPATMTRIRQKLGLKSVQVKFTNEKGRPDKMWIQYDPIRAGADFDPATNLDVLRLIKEYRIRSKAER